MMLQNYWYIAALGSDIKRELCARTILCKPVVLYRQRNGAVAALEDRCAHRHVSLSLGRLIDDRVQCTYHGLEFDGSGKCVHIPAQERIPAKACVKSYPVAERDGFVWIWMGDPAQADVEQIPHYFMCSSPDYAGGGGVLHIQSNYVLTVENILDLSHIPYMHPGAYANDATSQYPGEVRVEAQLVAVTRVMPNVANPPLYQKAMGITGNVDRTQEIRYWPGGNLRMQSTFRPAGADPSTKPLNICIYAQVTPETEKTHYLYVGMFRDFAIESEEITSFISRQIVTTFMEDRTILVNQQRNWDSAGPDARMIDIAVDRGPLEARRMIRRLHEQENADAGSASIVRMPLGVQAQNQLSESCHELPG